MATLVKIPKSSSTKQKAQELIEDIVEELVVQSFLYLGKDLTFVTHKTGDNGDDDIGFELKEAGARKVIIDFGIMKRDDYWYLMINKKTFSMDDFVEYVLDKL